MLFERMLEQEIIDNQLANAKQVHSKQPELIRLKGGHNWNIWRQCLSNFLEKL